MMASIRKMDPNVAAKYNAMTNQWKKNVAAGKINVTPRHRETPAEARQKLINMLAALPPPKEHIYSNMPKASTVAPFAFPAGPSVAAPTANAPAANAPAATKKKWNVKMPKYIRGGRKATRKGRKAHRKTRRGGRK